MSVNTELKVEKIRIDDLSVYSRNTKVHPRRANRTNQK